MLCGSPCKSHEKSEKKNVRPLVFGFSPKNLALWCFLFCFFKWFARFQILICEPQSIWCKVLTLSLLYKKKPHLPITFMNACKLHNRYHIAVNNVTIGHIMGNYSYFLIICPLAKIETDLDTSFSYSQRRVIAFDLRQFIYSFHNGLKLFLETLLLCYKFAFTKFSWKIVCWKLEQVELLDKAKARTSKNRLA